MSFCGMISKVTWLQPLISLVKFYHEVLSFNIHSNTFTNEKMKLEECIKKGREDYEEILQRAVAAEVSPRHLVTGRQAGCHWFALCLVTYGAQQPLLKSVQAEGGAATHNATSLNSCSVLAYSFFNFLPLSLCCITWLYSW